MIWILCQLISVAENMKKCNWWDSILNCRSVSRTNKFPHSMKFCSDNSGTVTFHNDAPRRSNNFVNHNTKCYFPCFKTFRNWLRSKKRGKSFRKNFWVNSAVLTFKCDIWWKEWIHLIHASTYLSSWNSGQWEW